MVACAYFFSGGGTSTKQGKIKFPKCNAFQYYEVQVSVIPE